ncbi:MAG: ribonuclease inhibitor [Flavisolibacter sp.]
MRLLTIVEFFGRLHPALVHLPIGILLTALFLQWLTRFPRYKVSIEVIKIILLAGILSSLITCITGFILSTSGEYEGNLVAWHMWMGISVAIASLVLLFKVVEQKFDLSHRIASFSLLALIIITGHLGGSLTHGSDYLSASFLQKTDTLAFKKKIIANIQEAKVYDDIIQPILYSKCYSCHDLRKQKGGLRMDDSSLLMKGGKDGKIISVGNAQKSEMVQRINLPLERDHHMPPREKPQLSDRQIALIEWWINEGAPFKTQVKDLHQSESIKPSLYALQNNHQEQRMPAILPDKEVPAADLKLIEGVREKGIILIPVAKGSNYLLADFVSVSQASDQDIELLLPLKKQLIWLKLAGTLITDKAMAMVASFPILMSLDLTHTQITDEGVKHLSKLYELQSLNLVGTNTGAEGLRFLGNLKKLQAIYLYHTKIKSIDLPSLRKIFPKTHFELGDYSIPFLNTDTIIEKPKIQKKL